VVFVLPGIAAKRAGVSKQANEFRQKKTRHVRVRVPMQRVGDKKDGGKESPPIKPHGSSRLQSFLARNYTRASAPGERVHQLNRLTVGYTAADPFEGGILIGHLQVFIAEGAF
jgi:hypothetical protein